MSVTPLLSPRSVACPKCRARTLTACKRIKAGRKVEIEFMKGFHAERRAEFKRLTDAASEA